MKVTNISMHNTLILQINNHMNIHAHSTFEEMTMETSTYNFRRINIPINLQYQTLFSLFFLFQKNETMIRYFLPTHCSHIKGRNIEINY